MKLCIKRLWPLVLVIMFSGCQAVEQDHTPPGTFAISAKKLPASSRLVTVGGFILGNPYQQTIVFSKLDLISWNVENKGEKSPFIRLRIVIDCPNSGELVLDREEIFRVEDGLAIGMRAIPGVRIYPDSFRHFRIRMQLIESWGEHKATLKLVGMTFGRRGLLPVKRFTSTRRRWY